IVMAFADGQPFGRVRRLLRPTDPEHVALGVHVLRRVLDGLDYAHKLRDASGASLGLVHRDVSPDNVVIGYDGQVTLLDFGIAKVRGQSVKTATGVFMGKVRYASPEQITGRPVDHRADVYAVGAMLWELLSGRRLWEKANLLRIYQALMEGRL